MILAASLAALPFEDDYLMTTLAVAFVSASAGILSLIAAFWISLGAGEAQSTKLGRQTTPTTLGDPGPAAGGLPFAVILVPNAPFTLTAVLVATALVASIGLPKP